MIMQNHRLDSVEEVVKDHTNLLRLKSMTNSDVTVTLVEDDEEAKFFQGI